MRLTPLCKRRSGVVVDNRLKKRHDAKKGSTAANITYTRDLADLEDVQVLALETKALGHVKLRAMGIENIISKSSGRRVRETIGMNFGFETSLGLWFLSTR